VFSACAHNALADLLKPTATTAFAAMPTIAACSKENPIHIVHLDAHFDFIDVRNSTTCDHGSPMQPASKMPHAKGITALGPRNMAAPNCNNWHAARAHGTYVVSSRKLRAEGVTASLSHTPDGEASISRSTSATSSRRSHPDRIGILLSPVWSSSDRPNYILPLPSQSEFQRSSAADAMEVNPGTAAIVACGLMSAMSSGASVPMQTWSAPTRSIS
jgi:hypothetical protein